MALSVSNLTKAVATNASSMSTSSISPSSNALILVAVATRNNLNVTANEPTVSGNGLTYEVIQTAIHDDIGSTRRRVTLFRALGASPTAGAVSVDLGGQTQTDIVVIVDQVTGVDTGGTNGSGAIVQSDKNTSSSATSLTVTLGSFSSANNYTYGAFSHNNASGETINPGSGFTELEEQDSASNISVQTEYLAGNDTTVDSSTSGSTAQNYGGIAIEIKEATAAGLTITSWTALSGVGQG